MRYAPGKSQQRLRTTTYPHFRRWILGRYFRLYPFYCRSGRNIAADLPSLASASESAERTTSHQSTRIYSHSKWHVFRQPTQPSWHEWRGRSDSPPRSRLGDFGAAEWRPSAFALRAAAMGLYPTCQWVDPRHTRIERQASPREYSELPQDLFILLADFRTMRKRPFSSNLCLSAYNVRTACYSRLIWSICNR